MHITEIGSISSSIIGEGSKNVTEIRGSFRFEVAGMYRVTMVVVHLGWVELDLGCSTLLLGSR